MNYSLIKYFFYTSLLVLTRDEEKQVYSRGRQDDAKNDKEKWQEDRLEDDFS